MFGLAQQKFIEKEKISPWGLPKRFFSAFHWPLLESLMVKQLIPFVDFALAELLLKNHSHVDEAVATFICHLSISSRAGHLCVKVSENRVVPDPSDSWPCVSENNFEEDQLQVIRKAIIQGAKLIPRDLIEDVEELLAFPSAPICRFGDLYYLQRYWSLENCFFKELKRIIKDAPSLILNQEILHDKVVAVEGLLPEQKDAILKGCQQNLTIVSGGPGTGKTYTAGYFLRIFWESLSKEDQQRCRIALAAPTGKAASNLEKSIQKTLQDVDGFPKLNACTLHSLLGIRNSRTQLFSKSFLEYDLLIIDESSMIDVNLMAQLMTAIKPGSRLILLGDKHQLPSIEAGSLFSDLTTYLGKEYVGELQTCLRMESKGIIDLAAKVNAGDSNGALTLLSQSQNGVCWTSCDLEKEPKKWQQELLNYALPLLPTVDVSDNAHLFSALSRFRLLAPYRQGPFGVNSLNQLFLEASLKNVKGEWFVAPIMIVKNDYRLQLFNGEIGVLVKNVSRMHEGKFLSAEDFAIFPSKDPLKEPVSKYSALLLPAFEYAYCLSIFKSQGSEFDHVLLVLPEAQGGFSRELLYTAITRAKRSLEIWGDRSSIQQVISRHTYRQSGIASRQL